jgi:hypothetical protein
MERLDNDFEPHMVDIPGVKVEGGGFLADDSGLVLRNEPEECRETRERALEAWLVVKDQNTYKLGVVRAYGNIPCHTTRIGRIVSGGEYCKLTRPDLAKSATLRKENAMKAE